MSCCATRRSFPLTWGPEMLTVSSLFATYSGIAALSNVSISIEQGEMIALIGSNGAGKSTLLNCLSGIVSPTAGSINFNGVEIERWSAHRVARRGLLQVPEGRQIISDQSVIENLQLGMLAASRRATGGELDEVLELFPILQERKHQIAGSLSGGQQQMLAIGRAMMGAPEMLLLDEPSLGLSPLIDRKSVV